MSVLNETAKQMYQRLQLALKGKGKTTLENVASTCDEIEAAHGKMSYSRVGQVATARFGGPKPQSILNNRNIKTYIALRATEYEHRSHKRRAPPSSSEPANTSSDPYPAEGLDAKTRICIDVLRQNARRLHAENMFLTTLLEERTRDAPLSLADAIASGPTDTGALLTAVPSTGAPTCLRLALEIIFRTNTRDGCAETFAVRQRGGKCMLVRVDNGVETTLLTPNEWQQAVNWLLKSGR